MDRRVWWSTVHGVSESDTPEQLSLSLITHSQLELTYFFLSVKQEKLT